MRLLFEGGDYSTKRRLIKEIRYVRTKTCLYHTIGECRTLWGEREQAMHCSIELSCIAKALPLKYRSQHTDCKWHIAKTRFVTPLYTCMLAEKSLSWNSTT